MTKVNLTPTVVKDERGIPHTELDRIGYYTTNAAGEKILDYRILKKRVIWAYNTSGKAACSNNIEWY